MVLPLSRCSRGNGSGDVRPSLTAVTAAVMLVPRSRLSLVQTQLRRFTETYLQSLYAHVVSGFFGTFALNSDKERAESTAYHMSGSLWKVMRCTMSHAPRRALPCMRLPCVSCVATTAAEVLTRL